MCSSDLAAPGHGAEDYQTGLRYGLEILSPLDDSGQYTAEDGPYAELQMPDLAFPFSVP